MKPWHSLSPKETLEELKSSEKGLTTQEAQARLATYGANELKKEKGKSPIKMFLAQFTDILMIILLIATGLSIAVGEVVDAGIILAIVIASAVLGFTQEFRSEKAVEALKRMTAPTAIALRDNKEVKIQASQLVPGDVILLYTGDKIPADCRLLEGFNLKVDEAALTGESAPVEKHINPLSEETQLNDRHNLVFMGTIVVYGRAKAIVTTTGMQTEFGKIAQMVQATPTEETPLEKRMASVGKWIGILAIVVCIGVGSVGILVEGRNPIDMLLWAVSLAVAAVPEAMPAIVTGALAIGMYRMAKVNTIVKRLPAVETLGSTSVICSDKTGTMTKGEMTVQSVYVHNDALKVTGIGYSPKGEFQLNDEKVQPNADLKQLLKVATLCNDSALERDTQTEKWIIKGDPTEGALIVAAAKADIWKQDLERQEPRIAEIPFSSERKLMTTIHEVGNRKVAYMKGAPEIVLQKCTTILQIGKPEILTEEKRAELMIVTEHMASEALRNLGFAYRELPEHETEYSDATEAGFTFVGIIGMIDPPRSEVKDAISVCRSAGIRVVMITGDHKITATAVARDLGLLSKDDQGKVLTGSELEDMSDEQLIAKVEDIAIYARVAPEHKMRIVKAWKSKNQVVAMTGDGVNDAPALKMADIGIAMGITGTEVTKEAADMVLADDNFASIVKAVREGREIFGNIKKYLTYLLQCNIMEIFVMFVAVVFVPYLASALSRQPLDAGAVSNAAIALTAVQLLWMNLVTDGLPAIALGVDPGDPDLMQQKPRKPSESVFSGDVKVYLAVMPLLMGGLLLGAFFMHNPWLGNFQLLEARTQLLTAMIVMELVVALSCRSLKYPVFRVGVFKNRFLWYALLSSFALQLLILYAPGVQAIFDVHQPEVVDWAIAALFGAIVFTVLEVGKYVACKRRGDM